MFFQILTALCPPWFYKACGVGQQWPLPSEKEVMEGFTPVFIERKE